LLCQSHLANVLDAKGIVDYILVQLGITLAIPLILQHMDIPRIKEISEFTINAFFLRRHHFAT